MNAILASIPDAQRRARHRAIDGVSADRRRGVETVKIGRRTLIRVSSIRALAGEGPGDDGQ
jgi:hypothetical protein